jgi:mono/diheme cytochrome c family protein
MGLKYIWLVLFCVFVEANEDGKKVYMSKCISCHNKDPSLKGSVGPDIADSNMPLLIFKTQHKKYPKGYKPKRKTNIMPKIPMKDKEIMALYEYINSFNKGRK